MTGQVGFIGQARCGVFCGEAGDIKRGAHSLLQRSARKIGRAGVAPALSRIDRDAQRFVAIALNVFHGPQTRRDRQTYAFRGFSRSVGRAEFAGKGQRIVHELREPVGRVGKAAVRLRRCLGRG